jgi:5'-deoxynucleotidase YfbR-like HD superfamily hydrolase
MEQANKFTKIIQTRAGGRVERCHSFTKIGSYNVAEHSWNVAMLGYYLYSKDFERLCIHYLVHDVHEAWVGDIPSPVRKYALDGSVLEKIEKAINLELNYPSACDLSDEDKIKIRSCDQLEFYFWAREQELLGNKFIRESLIEIERYFDENPLEYKANKLYLFAKDMEDGFLPRQQGVIKEIMEKING